jgi:DNA-binding beta-propeller fold protein YncE
MIVPGLGTAPRRILRRFPVTPKPRARRPRVSAVAFSFAALCLLIASTAALAVTGELTQLPGTAACVSETGTSGACVNGRGLNGALRAAVSPDGDSVYVASSDDSVAVFERDAITGAISQPAGTAGCVSQTGSSGACTDGKSLLQPVSPAVSPDGKSVYVASFTSRAVAVFRRDTATGQLTQLAGTAGCVSEKGTAGNCADGKALNHPVWVAVSPDGTSVYVASRDSDTVAAFRRDTTTGQLTQLAGKAGCISETGSDPDNQVTVCADGKALDGAHSVTVSPDGKSVYVASRVSDAVAVLRRNPTTGALFQPAGTGGCVSETGSEGACADGKALDGAGSVAASGDGKSVYIVSEGPSHAVAVFRRNATTGALTQLSGPAGKAGCVSQTGTAGACADGKALLDAWSVAVSTDGQSVYVTSLLSNAVAIFRRNTTSGALTQLAGTAGCVSESGSNGACGDGIGLDDPTSVALSGDGKSVYVASFESDAVAAFARETPP